MHFKIVLQIMDSAGSDAESSDEESIIIDDKIRWRHIKAFLRSAVDSVPRRI